MLDTCRSRGLHSGPLRAAGPPQQSRCAREPALLEPGVPAVCRVPCPTSEPQTCLLCGVGRGVFCGSQPIPVPRESGAVGWGGPGWGWPRALLSICLWGLGRPLGSWHGSQVHTKPGGGATGRAGGT